MRSSQILASQRDRVLDIAHARGASAVRVFGSVANGLDHDDNDDNDIDLLVNMPTGTSLLHIVALQLELEDVLGRKVDLCTEAELHQALRPRILAEARPL